jgi:hypothetical protein
VFVEHPRVDHFFLLAEQVAPAGQAFCQDVERFLAVLAG